MVPENGKTFSLLILAVLEERTLSSNTTKLNVFKS